MAHRMEVVRDLEDELFVLMTLGDDRAVRKPISPASPSSTPSARRGAGAAATA